MALFFTSKKRPQAELVSSNSPSEAVQVIFDGVFKREDEHFWSDSWHKHPGTDIVEFAQTPIREVKLDGQTYFVCARSTNAEIWGGDPRNGSPRDNEKQLNFYVLSPDGSIARYEQKVSSDDTSLLDINEVRRQAADKKLSDVIDKFFLVTPEERQAYQEGKKYPDMYTKINPKSYVGQRKYKMTRYYGDAYQLGMTGLPVQTTEERDDYVAKYYVRKDQVYEPSERTTLSEFMPLDENVMYTDAKGKKVMIKAGGALNITDENNISGIQAKDLEENYVLCDDLARYRVRRMFKEATANGGLSPFQRKLYANQLKRTTPARRTEADQLREAKKMLEAKRKAIRDRRQAGQ